jgi:glycosyltransferase involved in cell wall biosynthesis
VKGALRAAHPLTVVTVVDSLGRGGAEGIARAIAVRLDPARFRRVLWVTRADEGAVGEDLAAAGVEVHRLERRSARELAAWRPFLEYLRRQRVDVLHLHKFGSNVWGSVLGRVAGVPVIVAQEHTWSYEGEPLRRLLDRHVVARLSDVFVAVSREDRRRMIEVERIDQARIRLVPNGIPPLPPPSGHDLRAELGLPADAPLLGSVSVLRPQKALHVLVEAAALLARDFPELRVAIAGRGPEDERLRALARERGLEQVVTLLGLRRDVPDLLAAFDVAVNCSAFEGSPLAVMEYMAGGKAVVATRVGGVPDLVEDGVTGLLVEPGDPHALAEAVARLLRDPALRAELGTRACERQAREFSIDATVRRFEDLYESLRRPKI